MPGCMETAAKLVFFFLTGATKLQRLSLAFGRLVDGYLQPTYGSRERAGERLHGATFTSYSSLASESDLQHRTGDSDRSEYIDGFSACAQGYASPSHTRTHVSRTTGRLSKHVGANSYRNWATPLPRVPQSLDPL
ncbi:hypothetical protein COCC4DRAFT_33168 [Bipolaris maydis ATCC 48331]|uniref:Uncharacterized protein n=2 Tax=Cochliobolus heterostrophus TaxID=5016 RepID=M2SMU8_COCH5|nr:uncharacterized protein COCC4DRAFT_33168 [Bipolaris maydis ATCC 48331]EMD86670.1 hypothetical protein COCHEDRAFT_1023876 [Bipolaris maydis C5]ENI03066.1 hypothetical protein COCC4DRAFT_33168 [Bipolaris maydis ATCC 48331]